MRALAWAKDETKSVAYTGTAGNTGNFRVGPGAVWVWATTDAYIGVGGITFTATTANSVPVPAYTPVKLRVPSNQDAFRVSAIQVSAGGTVYAVPCTE